MNYYFDVLKKYVAFSGRARRKEFWMFVLVNVIITIILTIIGRVLFGILNLPAMVNLLANLYSLAVLLPSLGVAIRRMHDIGKSGWFILIPIYNIILCCQAGDAGDNKYGPDPKK